VSLLLTLRSPDGFAVTPQDQSRLLADTFFPRTAPHAQIITDFDPPRRPARPFPDFTLEELVEALKGTSNTSAPGSSGIGYQLIKWAFWEDAECLWCLYSACIWLGHHPHQWCTTLIIIVPKPRKPNMSDPKSYRPIALLECFSKLLEKLIAMRLQHDICTLDLVPHLQFGGRLRCGTNDAGLTMLHDIQTAISSGQFLTVLAFDVKGLFDNINHEWLVHTLDIFGFHPNLVAWTRSFLSECSVSICLGNTPSDSISIANVGVPQGSPLSPALAAIYTSPCWPDWPEHVHLDLQCYVDDGAIKALGSNPYKSNNFAAVGLVMIECRLNAVGLLIDRGPKLECSVFASRHKLSQHPPAPQLVIIHPDGQKSSVTLQCVWRFLGIFFTPTLTWHKHVSRMANKAIAVCRALQLIANCVRG
jgi:hypothetical protein